MTTQDEGRDDKFFFTQVTEDEGTEILSDRPPSGCDADHPLVAETFQTAPPRNAQIDPRPKDV